jgi:hypothetical protein
MKALAVHGVKVAVGAALLAAGYRAPLAAVRRDTQSVQASIGTLRAGLRAREEVRTRMNRAGRDLLASKLDLLSARFRDGLARVGEQSGLGSVVVEHGQPQDVDSPVLDAKGISTDLKRELRRVPDFQVVRGTVRGTGTLEQALRALGTLQVQPWVHRIEGFTLRPTGKSRERFELKVDVATIYSPALAGLAGNGGPMPELVAPSARDEESWRAIARGRMFGVPVLAGGPGEAPPVTIAAAAPDEAPPPHPTPFAPYEDWKLTGLAVGRTGPQALFLNLKTGDRLTVLKGGQVLDAIFVDGEGEQATVEIGGKKFGVSVGATLASRKPQV